MEILPMYMMLCNKSECEVFLVEALCVCAHVCVCVCDREREGGNIHPLKERKDLNVYFLFYFNIHVKQENTRNQNLLTAYLWKGLSGKERGGVYSSVQNPLFHQLAQYHMVVRSKACEERGGVYSSVQNPLFHQLAQYHMVVRSKACEERGGVYSAAQNRHQSAVPHGGQVENLWGKRWDLELNAEPSITLTLFTNVQNLQHVKTWTTSQKCSRQTSDLIHNDRIKIRTFNHRIQKCKWKQSTANSYFICKRDTYIATMIVHYDVDFK